MAILVFLGLAIFIISSLAPGEWWLYQDSPRGQAEVPATGADMPGEEETIRVLFPKGGEKLEIGKTYTIR